MLSFHGYLSPSECWQKALPASQKALKYGPDLSETRSTLAYCYLTCKGIKVRASKALREVKGIEKIFPRLRKSGT
jgi:hypothetical protein